MMIFDKMLNTRVHIQTYVDKLPSNTEVINLSGNDLVFVPDLSRFKKLKELNVSNNQLLLLPELNESLEKVDCSHNKIYKLPKLNYNLTSLHP